MSERSARNQWSQIGSDAWPAPAKINLFLRIVGRRDDGYHELQTAFQFLDIHDDLFFDVRRDGAIRTRHRLAEVAVEDDLVLRAAEELQHESGTRLGADIRLIKRLPMGAGLGGGSSDAATTLVALNALWGVRWSSSDLAKLGMRLGADVPVFVRGRSAWAEGIGEKLVPIELIERWYLLVFPPVHVPTATIFGDPELTRNSPRITIHAFCERELRNDCELVVRRRYPAVDNAMVWLSQYGAARLTGTGACCFLAFDSLDEARATRRLVPGSLVSKVVRGVNRSPLHDRLSAS